MPGDCAVSFDAAKASHFESNIPYYAVYMLP